MKKRIVLFLLLVVCVFMCNSQNQDDFVVRKNVELRFKGGECYITICLFDKGECIYNSKMGDASYRGYYECLWLSSEYNWTGGFVWLFIKEDGKYMWIEFKDYVPTLVLCDDEGKFSLEGELLWL